MSPAVVDEMYCIAATLFVVVSYLLLLCATTLGVVLTYFCLYILCVCVCEN